MSGNKNRYLKKIAQQQAAMTAKVNNEPCVHEFEATVGDKNTSLQGNIYFMPRRPLAQGQDFYPQEKPVFSRRPEGAVKPI